MQKSHGRSRPQVARPDELPRAVPAVKAAPSGAVKRTPSGRIADSEAAKLLGARGGRAPKPTRQVRSWAKTLGVAGLLEQIGTDELVAPAVREAESWYQERVQELAAHVGGGVCSSGAISIMKSAAWQRCFSSFLFECSTRKPWAFDVDEKRKPPLVPRLDLIQVASRLADASRQNVIAAFEVAAREAEARAKASGPARGFDATAAVERMLADRARREASPAAQEPPREVESPTAALDEGRQGEDRVDATEPPEPEGPRSTWLPRALLPWAPSFADMRGLDPAAFRAAVLPRAEALARTERVVDGAGLLSAVRTWLEEAR